MKTLSLFLCCFLFLAATAQAQQAPAAKAAAPSASAPSAAPAPAPILDGAPDPDKIAALQKIRTQAPDLQIDYLGKRYGMDAWLLSGHGVMQMVFTMPDTGAALLGGLLLDPQGHEVTSDLQQNFAKAHPQRAQAVLDRSRPDAAQAAGAAAAPQSADELWGQMGALGFVAYGTKDDAPLIYAMLDPSGPDSHKVWDKLLPLAMAGKFRLRAVPLAATTADDIMPVVQVLGAPEPTDAWRDLMDRKMDKLPATPSPKGPQGLKQNVLFAKALNLRQMPFLVYRQNGDPAKGMVRAVKGLPKDWDVFLKDAGLADAN